MKKNNKHKLKTIIKVYKLHTSHPRSSELYGDTAEFRNNPVTFAQ